MLNDLTLRLRPPSAPDTTAIARSQEVSAQEFRNQTVGYLHQQLDRLAAKADDEKIYMLLAAYGAKLKAVAYGAVPDELLMRCVDSALSEVGDKAA